jgi:hypothetical protein
MRFVRLVIPAKTEACFSRSSFPRWRKRVPTYSSSFPRRRESSASALSLIFALSWSCEQGFRSPAVSDLLLALPKGRQKARRLPCASRLSRSQRQRQHILCLRRRARIRVRAPAGIFRLSLRCSAPRRRHFFFVAHAYANLRSQSPALALDPACPSLLGSPSRCGGSGPRCPQGRREGSRRFRRLHRDVQSAEHRTADAHF